MSHFTTDFSNNTPREFRPSVKKNLNSHQTINSNAERLYLYNTRIKNPFASALGRDTYKKKTVSYLLQVSAASDKLQDIIFIYLMKA